MTRIPLGAAALALALALPACTSEERIPPPAEARRAEASARAADACRSLGLALMGELANALSAAPPEAAVDVCARIAQDTTVRIAREEGIAVRRTALHLRNPANAPDAWEREHLERWAAVADPTSIAPVDEVLQSGTGWELRQLRPILLQDLCVTCHGDREAMSEPLRARIAAHYPEDTAVGFAPGRLRGAFSVRVPIPAE